MSTFKKKFVKNKNLKDFLTGLLMLSPSLLIMTVFVFIPLFYSIYLSLTKWNFIDPIKTFIGFENYIKLFETPLFWKVVSNTLVFTIATVFFSLVFGLILAMILNQKIFGRDFYRSVIFFPYVTTPSALALVWVWIFDPQFGLMNSFLKSLYITGPEWLSSVKWALPAVIIMTIWRYTGYNMVIFLGGLQNIDRELLEAAQIDGANKWVEFWKIKLPLLSPTTFFIIITMMIAMFQVFDVIYVMTFGGPAYSTNVIVFYLYQQGFQFFKAGYASAVAVVLFVVIMGLTVIQNMWSKKWVVYG